MASKAQNSPAHAAINTANNAGNAQNGAVNAAINAITKNGGAIKIVMPDQNGDFSTAVSHSAVDKVQVVDVDMVLQMKDGTSVVLAGGAISAMDASHTSIKFNDGPQDTLSHLLDQVGMIAVPQLDQVLSSLQAPPGNSGEGAGSYSPSSAANTGMSASVTSQIVNQLTQIVQTNAQSATIQVIDPTAQTAVLSQNLNTGKIDSQPLQQVPPPTLPERPGVIPQEHTVGPQAPNMALSLVNLTTITQVGNVLFGSGGTVPSATDASNNTQFAPQIINAPADATEIHAISNIPPNNFIKVVNIAVTGDGIVQSVIVKGVPAGMSIANGTDMGGGNWSVPVAANQKNFDIQLEYTTTPADPNAPIHSQFSMEFDVNVTTSTGLVSMSEVKEFVVKDVNSANDLTFIDSSTGEGVYVLPAQGNSHVVHGGDGGVTIFGSNAADFLFGGAGADTINGGSGNSYFEGGAGADHMIGGIGINTIGYTLSTQGVTVNLAAGTGSGGDAQGDVFVNMTNAIGSTHNDIIIASNIANNIDGGGNDNTGSGVGPGDTVSYEASDAAVIVDLSTGAGIGGFAAGDKYTNIQSVIGSQHNDTFIASTEANSFTGGGHDTLGGDTVSYANATAGVTVDLFTGLGSGAAAGDSYHNIQNIIGTAANDVFIDGNGPNRYDGGLGGQDTVSYDHSTAGVDVNFSLLRGSGGFADGDSYINIQNVIGSHHDDTFEAGSDSKNFTGDGVDAGGFDTVSYASSGSAVTIDTINNSGSGGFADGNLYSGIEKFIGSAYNDTFIASNGTNQFDGGNFLVGGGNTVDYSHSDASVVVNLATGIGSGGYATNDKYTSIQNIIGSVFSDTFVASSEQNHFIGNGHDAAGDTVSYAASNLGVVVDLSNSIGTGTGGGYAFGDTFDNIQNLIGSTFDDTFVASTDANRFDGGGGTGVEHNRVSYANTPGALGGVTVDLTNSGDTAGAALGDTYFDIQDVTGTGQNDTFIASNQANAFDGGLGIDTVSYKGSTSVTVDLVAGTGSFGNAAGDTYTSIENVTGGEADDTFIANASANSFDGGGTSLNNTVSYAKASDSVGVTVDLFAGVGTNGFADGDHYVRIQDVIGSTNNDIFVADAAHNKFDGGGGTHDQVSYKDSTIADGSITVNLITNTGTGGLADGDTYAGIQDVTGGAADDTIIASNVANNFDGQGGSDTVSYAGTAGDNTIDLHTVGAQATGTGFAAGDTFTAIENIIGGAGNDKFYASAGTVANKFDGDGGINTVDYSKSQDAFGVIVDLSTEVGTGLGTGSGNGAANTLAGDAAGDTYFNIQNVVGTNNDDLFKANNMANNFDGQGGSDTVSYVGTAGDNTIDLHTLGAAATGTGYAAGDTYTGIENIIGGAGNDTFYASAGVVANKFDGDGGNNTVDYSKSQDAFGVIVDLSTEVGTTGLGTGSGNGAGNALAGDAAGDTYFNIQNVVGTKNDDLFKANDVANKFDGGLGNDTVSYIGTLGDNSINLKTSTPQAVSAGFANGDTYTSIENVIGGAGNDTFYASAAANKFDGDGGIHNQVNYSLSGDGFGVIVDLSTTIGTGSGNGAGHAAQGDAAGDTYVAIQDATGTLWDDTFIANGAVNFFDGFSTGHNRVSYQASGVADGSITVNLILQTGSGGLAEGDHYASIQDVTGGAADDLFIASNVANNFDGGLGNDTVSYIGTAGDNTIDLHTIGAAATGNGFAAGDTYTGIENVIGGSGNDTFYASNVANKFDGDGGIHNQVNYSLSGDGFGVIVDLSTEVGTTGLGTGSGNGAGHAAQGDAAGDTYLGIQDVTGTLWDDKFIANGMVNKFDGFGGTVHNQVSYQNSTGDVQVDLSTTTGTGTFGDAQGDTYVNIQDVTGGSGNDIFIASNAANNFDGGLGNDTVSYHNTNGDNSINLKNATVQAASAGFASGDTYTSIENVIGGNGNDTFYASNVANKFDGDGGADNRVNYSLSGDGFGVIVDLVHNTGASNGGGMGDATGDTYLAIQDATGTAWDDKFIANNVANQFDGFGGSHNRVSYEFSTTTVTVNLNTGLGSNGDATGDKYTSIQDATGGSGDDTFVGSTAANNFDGGAGSDTVDYSAATTSVVVNLSSGPGTPIASTGNALAAGDTYVNMENIIGGSGNDTLTGATGGNSTLVGGAGADLLTGQGSNNTASYIGSGAVTIDLTQSGAGSGGDAQGDVFVDIQNVIGSSNSDKFYSSSDANKFDGGAGGSDTVSYEKQDLDGSVGVGVNVDLSNGAGAATGGYAAGDTFANIHNLIGTKFADTLKGASGGGSTLTGGAGADTLTGQGFVASNAATANTANYATSVNGVTVDLVHGSGSGGDAQDDIISGIQNVIGTGQNDTFIIAASTNSLGGSDPNTVDGGAGGVDTVSYANETNAVTVDLSTTTGHGFSTIGGSTQDTLIHIQNAVGGSGNDTFLAGNLANNFDGGSGSDTVSYAASSTNALAIDPAHPTLTALNGVIVDLFGHTGSGNWAAGDTYATVGNINTIENIIGSGGSDLFISDDSTTTANKYDGGSGGSDTVSYEHASTSFTADLNTPGNNTGEAFHDTYSHISNLMGSAVDGVTSTLTGDGFANTLTALGANTINILNGGGASSGSDILDGRLGAHNTLNAGNVGDTIFDVGTDGIGNLASNIIAGGVHGSSAAGATATMKVFGMVAGVDLNMSSFNGHADHLSVVDLKDGVNTDITISYNDVLALGKASGGINGTELTLNLDDHDSVKITEVTGEHWKFFGNGDYVFYADTDPNNVTALATLHTRPVTG